MFPRRVYQSWVLLTVIIYCQLIIEHDIITRGKFACGAHAFAFTVTDTPPLLDVPTYSLATLNNENINNAEESSEKATTTLTTNMNILTYATPVSVSPIRVWAIGLYKETLTYKNFIRERSGILQLLCDPHHVQLVKLLGGTSGCDVNKQTKCTEFGSPWINPPMENGPLVLPKCIQYLHLSLLDDDDNSLIDAGSHVIAICRVDSMFVDNDDDDDNDDDAGDNNNKKRKILLTSTLRNMGIITEQGRVAE